MRRLTRNEYSYLARFAIRIAQMSEESARDVAPASEVWRRINGRIVTRFTRLANYIEARARRELIRVRDAQLAYND